MAAELVQPHLGCGRDERKPEWPGWHSGAKLIKRVPTSFDNRPRPEIKDVDVVTSISAERREAIPRPRRHLLAMLYVGAACAATVITVVITAVLGVPPLVPKNTWLATCWEGASRLIVSYMLIIELIIEGVACSAFLKPIFDDFDMTLPAVTQLLVDVSVTASTHWFLVAPAVLLGSAVEAGVFGVLHMNRATQMLAKGLSLVITGCATLIALLASAAIVLPTIKTIKLVQDLS